MNLVSLGIGFAAGFVLGGLAVVLYMRWKMMSQISAMQGEMEEMFDVTDDMMGDLDESGFEKADFEEVEREKEE